VAIVYKHTRKDNGNVFYIGIGVSEKRAYSKFERNSRWLKTVAKVGYDIDIALDNISWEEAKSWEVYLIGLYGRADLKCGNLVNMTNGGDGVVGRFITEEERLRRLELAKNRVISKETRIKISIANTGKKKSEEERRRISERVRGDKHPMYGIKGEAHFFYGRKHTEETKSLISERNKGKCAGGKNPKAKKVVDIDGNIVFNSGKDLSDSLKIPFGTIRCWLNGGRKSPVWFKYKYA
jgi:hypothetical protein